MFGGMNTDTNNSGPGEASVTDGQSADAPEVMKGAPKGNGEAGCPPPDEPIMVFCLHCGKEYMSSEMVPPSGKRTPVMMEGMWWCGTPGCNAGGFGLDIFPVDPEWKDPKGLVHIITDDEEEEDFEWDDDEE
jgi:hypothetical protein